jgi:hypothetical protein
VIVRPIKAAEFDDVSTCLIRATAAQVLHRIIRVIAVVVIIEV